MNNDRSFIDRIRQVFNDEVTIKKNVIILTNFYPQDLTSYLQRKENVKKKNKFERLTPWKFYEQLKNY